MSPLVAELMAVNTSASDSEVVTVIWWPFMVNVPAVTARAVGMLARVNPLTLLPLVPFSPVLIPLAPFHTEAVASLDTAMA